MRALPAQLWRVGSPLLLALSGCSSALDLGRDSPSLTPPSIVSSASCNGTRCFSGPVLDIGDSPGNARGLALDAHNVYWAASAALAVMVTPKDSGATYAIPTPVGAPYGVGLDDTHIYFTSRAGDFVASMPKDYHPAPKGIKAPEIKTLADGEPQPESMLVASEGVYFADELLGALKLVDSDGSALETVATGIYSGCDLALDAERLYYSDAGLGEVHAVDRVSHQNTLLVSGRAHPAAPLPRGQDLYFLELGTADASYADGRLLRMPRTGGNLEVLLENLDAPTGLAADANAVYVCTGGTALNDYRGKIVRRADDGQINTLAINQAKPFAIAVDDLAVYWTADGDSALRSVRR